MKNSNINMISRHRALIIFLLRRLILGTRATMFRNAMTRIRMFIGTTNMRRLVYRNVRLFTILRVISTRLSIATFRRILRRLNVPTSKSTLMNVIGMIIIGTRTGERPFSSGTKRLNTKASPLLLNMTLRRLLVSIDTGRKGNLLLRILKINSATFNALLLSLLLYFLKNNSTPRLVRNIRVRKRIGWLPIVINSKNISVIIGFARPISVIPRFPIKNIRGVNPMTIRLSTLRIFNMSITTSIIALISGRTFFALNNRFLYRRDTMRTNTCCRPVMIRDVPSGGL